MGREEGIGREEEVGREERAREKEEEGRGEVGRGGCRKRGESRGERREWGMLEVHWNWTAPYSSQLILTPPPH